MKIANQRLYLYLSFSLRRIPAQRSHDVEMIRGVVPLEQRTYAAALNIIRQTRCNIHGGAGKNIKPTARIPEIGE